MVEQANNRISDLTQDFCNKMVEEEGLAALSAVALSIFVHTMRAEGINPESLLNGAQNYKKDAEQIAKEDPIHGELVRAAANFMQGVALEKMEKDDVPHNETL